jgi:hypothetical protein
MRVVALGYQLVGVEGQADDCIGQGRGNGGHECGPGLRLMRTRETHGNDSPDDDDKWNGATPPLHPL